MMKPRKRFVLMVSILALSILACRVGELFPGGGTTVRGSGNVVTQVETITGFDKVDISHAFEVDISQGDAFSVVVRADDNLVEYLQVVKEGNTLQIGLVPNPPNIQSATLQAEVTMPELAGLDIRGAAHAAITGFKPTETFVVLVSGASHLRGDLEADDVSFAVGGSSEVVLTGSAQNVTIEAEGSSDVDLADFPVVDANVKAGGASQVTVNVSGRLDVDASSASHVYYLGSPTLGKMDTSGSSSIEQK
jgi:hypothetical protein